MNHRKSAKADIYYLTLMLYIGFSDIGWGCRQKYAYTGTNNNFAQHYNGAKQQIYPSKKLISYAFCSCGVLLLSVSVFCVFVYDKLSDYLHFSNVRAVF